MSYSFEFNPSLTISSLLEELELSKLTELLNKTKELYAEQCIKFTELTLATHATDMTERELHRLRHMLEAIDTEMSQRGAYALQA